MKIKVIVVSVMLLITSLFQNALAAEKATPAEVYEMVLKAAEVIEQLGEEGLSAFMQKGEFTWKDSYVFVFNCSKLELAAHPNNKLIGLNMSKLWDKNKDKSKRKLHVVELCQRSTNPNGAWVEYYWEKLGETEPARKISFIIKVPGQPYEVSAGIYDDSMTLEELQALTAE